MSTSNKISTKIVMEKSELEATMHMRLDELKSETCSSIDIKISALSLNKPSSSCDQPSADFIKWPLFKSQFKNPHA